MAAAAHTGKEDGFLKLTEASAAPYRLVRCMGCALELELSPAARQHVILNGCERMSVHEARATAVELTLLNCSACTLRLESLASTVILIDCDDVEVDAPHLSALRIYRCANIRAWCKEACDVLEEENARQPAILRRGNQKEEARARVTLDELRDAHRFA